MNSNKINRLAEKLVSNLKSVLFHLIYYFLEVPWAAYNLYIQKRSLKNLGIRYPIINSIRFNNVNFLIYFASKGIIEEIILKEGSYEGNLLTLADCFIGEKTIIIDVGANIGFESLYFAKKYPGNLVFSYEPASFAHQCLSRSKEINRCENLKIFKMGVGDKGGQMQINAPTHNSYNKGLAAIDNNFDLDDTFVKETIAIVTLDEHIKENQRVSFIKIDVQGYEQNVLRGALDLIGKDRPVIIFEHYDSYHSQPLEERKKIESLFSSMNYEFYLIRAGRFMRPHHFLEKIALGTTKEIHGDIVAIPLHSSGEGIP